MISEKTERDVPRSLHNGVWGWVVGVPQLLLLLLLLLIIARY